MKRLGLACIVACVSLVAAARLAAQTSYPMLMSLRPVAVQQGQTSEHVVQSRYNLLGAYQVLVTGEGVQGEVIPPEVKPGERPNLQQMKLKFTAAADALPGVREFRVATPQGVSTVGQLVVVRERVIAEQADNDQPTKAQKIAVPSAVCGATEKNEDIDYYQFEVAAGTTLNFHVRGGRLQDKIHDLQLHLDPILTLRSAAGVTLASSDNYFFADPALSYRFEQAGNYLLEIRDVRYKGNQYWEYCVEISDQPFVHQVYPLAATPGAETRVEMMGFQIPADAAALLALPADAPRGLNLLPLKVGDALTNPVPVFVTNLPLVAEAAGDNNAPAGAQLVAIPSGINGRLESDRDIDCYAFEAKAGDAFSIQVRARRLQSSLDSILRILNDKGQSLLQADDSQQGSQLTSDSWIESWTAPADGKYTLEIRDLHLRGGPSFPYFIELTPAEPHFVLRADTDKTQLSPGISAPIFVRVQRKNGFTADVQLEVEGLPPGVTASCGRILEKGTDGCILLTAAADAPLGVANVKIRGTALHPMPDGSMKPLACEAQPQQEIYMPGGGRSHWPVDTHAVAVGAPSDIRAVKLSTQEITLQPGGSQRIDVVIERSPDYKGNVTLDVVYQHLGGVFGNSLPEGVTLDAKNSKTLLTGAETQGHITLIASDKAPPVEKQQIAVMANIAINFVMKATYSGPPVTVTVAAP